MAHDPKQLPLLFRDVHVVTGDGGELEGVDVLIRGGRIHEINERRLNAPGAHLIEGKGRTLIPGLIDAHTHLDFLSVRSAPRSWFQTRFVLPRALRELLRNGVTTIRCMADPIGPVNGLRRRASKGRSTAPAIVAAGPALTATGGHPESTLARDNRWLRTRIARTVDGPEQARVAVRALHAAGVDLVKFVYQGGLYGPERVRLQKLSPEVARAIVAEAHRLGLPVSAHTHYQDDVATLVEMGVDSIEHGVIEHEVDDAEVLRAWAEAGARLVPTLTIAALFPNPDGTFYIKTASRNLTRAYEAGVRIVAGTDSMVGAMPANSLHDELRRMVEAGMAESDVIRAATGDSAELLGLRDRGMVEVGRRADLILLGSNPLERIENIADIDVVVQDGALVHVAPEPPKPPALGIYRACDPPVLEYIDRTKGTVPQDSTVRYDRARFAAEGIRTLAYLDRATGAPLRTETVRSGPDLVTREWWCEIPAEQTSLHAVSDGHRIALDGSVAGDPVTRSYPLRGQTWMQLLLFDAATFITAADRDLGFVAIGASGRGALQLTDFELTRTGSAPDRTGSVEAELVMPRWRRFWGAITHFDADTGDVIRQQIRGKKDLSMDREMSAQRR